MVRLQGDVSEDKEVGPVQFQFLYGTITSENLPKYMPQTKVDFNSFMVRLQGSYRFTWKRTCNLFQFLYGTITSNKSVKILPQSIFISIPLWYDYKLCY